MSTLFFTLLAVSCSRGALFFSRFAPHRSFALLCLLPILDGKSWIYQRRMSGHFRQPREVRKRDIGILGEQIGREHRNRISKVLPKWNLRDTLGVIFGNYPNGFLPCKYQPISTYSCHDYVLGICLLPDCYSTQCVLYDLTCQPIITQQSENQCKPSHIKGSWRINSVQSS